MRSRYPAGEIYWVPTVPTKVIDKGHSVAALPSRNCTSNPARGWTISEQNPSFDV
jgi:hypothetical protein